MLFYGCVLPAMIKENKNDQSTKKRKINSTTVVLIIFTLCMIGPILKLISEVYTLIS